MEKEEYQKKLECYCGNCKCWKKQEEIETTNVYSNVHGEDVVEFKCCKCETKQKSLVI